MSDAQWDQVRLGVLSRRAIAIGNEMDKASFAEEPIYCVQLIRDRQEIRREMTAIHNRQLARGERLLVG